MLESVSIHGVTLKKTSELVPLISSLKQRVILCGHSHVFRSVYLADNRLIINAGSVGLPAYCDEQPYPHTMESGSPHAKYCIVSRDDSEYSVEFIEVPYKWPKAAEIASVNNREDWAQWLKTGRKDGRVVSQFFIIKAFDFINQVDFVSCFQSLFACLRAYKMLETTEAKIKFHTLTFWRNFWSDLDKEKEMRNEEK